MLWFAVGFVACSQVRPNEIDVVLCVYELCDPKLASNLVQSRHGPFSGQRTTMTTIVRRPRNATQAAD